MSRLLATAENVLLANPLTNTCTSTRENTSNDLNPIFINWRTVCYTEVES